MTICNLVISELTSEGEGVAYEGDHKIFVKGAFLGENVEVELFGEKAKYSQGRLLKVIKPSVDRCESFCEVNCGACAFTSLNYAAELEFKKNIILNLFREIPDFTDSLFGRVLPMDDPFAYRNKAVYACGESNGKVVLGLYERNSHKVIEISNCRLEQDWMNEARLIVQNNITDALNLRYLFLRGSNNTPKMAVLVCRSELTEINEISEELAKIGIENVLLNINCSMGNRILGDDFRLIKGSDQIKLNLLGCDFMVKPDSFFQINSFQTENLYKLAVELLNPTKDENVADLYCGIGTISLYLSDKVNHVYGIECVETAVNNALENAKLSGATNVEFKYGLVEKELPKLIQNGEKVDCAILDPARKGCDESVFETLSNCGANRIVYISCNPISQCRDIIVAQKFGYKLEKVEAVDMFPHTSHVETVVLLSREK